MLKVSIVWRLLTMFVLGIVFGTFITVKWIPPSTQVKIGSVKVKGRNNTVRDMFDLTVEEGQDPDRADPDSPNEGIYPTTKKQERKAKRADKKTDRLNRRSDRRSD